MKSAKFTVYQLKNTTDDFDKYCEEIVNDYHSIQSEHSEEYEYKLKEINPKNPLKHIEKVKIYLAQHKTAPQWKDALNELISDDIRKIENISHSFLFFIKSQNNFFVITGGKGHLVISEYKNYAFGLDILSKIMLPKDNIIKSTTDRSLQGNRFSGQQHFNNFVNLISENSISNFFKQINTFLTKDKIYAEFGVKVTEKKAGFNFLARDSIKLGKSLNLNNLDNFIKNLDRLINDVDSEYSINKFHEVDHRDSLFKELNSELERQYLDSLTLDEKDIKDSNIKIISSNSLYIDCDYYVLKKRNSTSKELERFETEIDIADINNIFKKFYFENITNNDKSSIENFFKVVSLEGYVDNERMIYERIFDLLEINIVYKNTQYILINGKWFYLDQNFIEEINKTFVDRIIPIYETPTNSISLKEWKNKDDEGAYNFSYHDSKDYYVLDKMLVRNIEVCDLLKVHDNEISLIHVKDGLAGSTRILCEQILIAMESIQTAMLYNDHNFLTEYYKSINNKNKPGISDSSRKSAVKFINKFKSSKEFVDEILNPSKKITFVFAFRSKNHDLYNPETITSTPAKISMLNLISQVKRFDFGFRIIEIKTKD